MFIKHKGVDSNNYKQLDSDDLKILFYNTVERIKEKKMIGILKSTINV